MGHASIHLIKGTVSPVLPCTQVYNFLIFIFTFQLQVVKQKQDFNAFVIRRSFVKMENIAIHIKTLLWILSVMDEAICKG